MKDKYILTDCDGVCLDWEEAFMVWMENRGQSPIEDYKKVYSVNQRFDMKRSEARKIVSVFNESAAIGFLPPLRDAQYYIKKLHEKHKYKFIAVTSLSLDPYAQKLRERNLNKLFGENTFEKVICLDTGADKDEILAELSKKYRGCYWIEDKPENANVGADVGFESLLIEHGHNMHSKGDLKTMKNWEDVYNEVTRS